VVVYDGACGFCVWWVRLALRLARRRTVRFVAFQALRGRFADFGLDEAACRAAVQFVSAGSVTSGAYALNDIAAAIGAGRLVAPFLRFPALMPAENRLYGWVAANRAWISRGLGMRRFARYREPDESIPAAAGSWTAGRR